MVITCSNCQRRLHALDAVYVSTKSETFCRSCWMHSRHATTPTTTEICRQCGRTVHSPDVRARYCSGACRAAAFHLARE
jgi:hypothetical protein